MMMKSVMLSAALLTLPVAAWAGHDEPVASIHLPTPSVRLGVGISVGQQWTHDSYRDADAGYDPRAYYGYYGYYGNEHYTYRPRAQRHGRHHGHHRGHAKHSRGHSGGHYDGHYGERDGRHDGRHDGGHSDRHADGNSGGRRGRR